VLKGPAASALYGTAAANGVIVVTTKKGTAGTTRWRAYVEGASLVDPNNYPANYTGFCSYVSPGGSTGSIAGCDTGYLLDLQAAGYTMTMDSVQVFNPLKDKGLPSYPFQTGLRQKYGLSAQGGTERVTYYLSGDWSHEKGIYTDVSNLKDLNLRTNLNAQLTDKILASVHVGYVNSNLRLPQNDNDILGILPSAFLGGSTPETAYGFFTLPDLKAIDTEQKVERFIGSSRVTINPYSWLSFNGTVGMDLIQRHDNETIPPQRVFYGSLPEGERTSNRLELGTYTAQGNASADLKLTESIGSTTNLGVQYVDDQFHGTYAYGRGLLAGCYSLNCVAAGYSVDESNSDSKTFGAYVSEQLSFNDRLYVTGTLRGDDNSAFGKNLHFTLYPSTNVSWIIGEEPWFPQIPKLSLLRLRAGYGVAGLQPGFRTARRYLNPASTVIAGQVVPAFTFGGVGNPDLKPEISKEVEVGADLGFFRDRFGLEVTYYNKKSHDALVSRDLPPSLGVATSQTINIGKVQNTGIELLARGTVIRRDDVVWDASVSYSTVNNKLLSLGKDPNTGDPIQPIIFGLGGDTQRFQEGFPLGAYFARSYTYKDANGDGYISTDEVTLADTASYQGSPFPTKNASIQSSVTLFNWVRVSALMDYQGGYKLFNGTEDFRCAAYYNCHDAYAGYPGVNVPLADQAAYVADAYGPAGGTVAGYMQDATFWKLREVTVTVTLPRRWATMVQTEGIQLTLAGRNLGTWTNYRGPDPEINGGGSGSNFNTFDFLSQPPIRYYTIRLDLTF
jgi:TonB-dependent SusC/RagA subfamily outer membrane receptor